MLCQFHISQNDHSVRVLENIQNYLHCGHIKENHHGRKNDQTFVYVVRNRIDLSEKIIPFFQEFSLLSEAKRRNFEIFCEVAKLMDQGEHKNLQGLKKILELRELINEGKGRTRKYGIKDIFPDWESSETIRQPLN